MPNHSWQQVLVLDKVGVAERQFKQAVRLFFSRGDPVSIHALASASVQVLSDLLTAQGAGGVTRNRALFNQSRFKEWIGKIKEAENFMKHADEDPDSIFSLDTNTTALMLLEASALIEYVAQRVVPEARLYMFWAMKVYPDVFTLTDDQRAALSSLDENDLELWAAAVDDPEGLVANAMKHFKPPAVPKTAYDIFLNRTPE